MFIRSTLALLLLASAPATADEPIVLADFEGPDYAGWTATGEALGDGPARGTLPGQMPVSGYLGDGLVNTFRGGDRTTGTLESPPFAIQRDLVWFLIGGGGYPGETCVELLVDGEIVRSATGPNTAPGGTEALRPHSWDVADLRGKSAVFRVVDHATGGWGHINVDHVVHCDEPPTLPDEREALLDRAARSVAEAAARVAGDPTRPIAHFRPPANWMNDPNGTIHVDGYYHLFYQHNPYGDAWGHMHWGHTRSRDLVSWEHLPIALWPSERSGEQHVFSGCAAVNGSDQLMLFYTSVGPGRPNEQWAALPIGDDLRSWRKHPANPLITTTMPDGTTFGPGMRDPFIFHHEGRTFLVVGADTETEAVIPIFEARDASLSDWEYKGILWRAPKSEIEFPECPNFFPLGEKFVLLLSPYRPVEYRVGTFDPEALTFTPETMGRVDQSDQFYASNVATTPDGRTILFGWVRGFPGGRGWNGCLAIPRELSIGPDGHLRQWPVRERRHTGLVHRPLSGETGAAIIRGKDAAILSESVTDASVPLDGLDLEAFELTAELPPAAGESGPGRFGLRLEGADGEEIATIGYHAEDGTIDVAGTPVAVDGIGPDSPLVLHAYVDRSVLEVFVDDRTVVTRVLPYRGGPITPVVFSEGGTLSGASLICFELLPVWPDADGKAGK